MMRLFIKIENAKTDNLGGRNLLRFNVRLFTFISSFITNLPFGHFLLVFDPLILDSFTIGEWVGVQVNIWTSSYLHWAHVLVHIHYFLLRYVTWNMWQIILKRIVVNYSCFDTGEGNFKCVMLGFLEGAYKKFAPSFDFVFLLCRRLMTTG